MMGSHGHEQEILALEAGEFNQILFEILNGHVAVLKSNILENRLKCSYTIAL